MPLKNKKVVQFIAFIKARHDVYTQKAAGAPRPWTTDKILQRYKFCNVYRELDRTTQWIGENWRKPNEADPDLWFAMYVARCINYIPTLEELRYPVPWNSMWFKRILEARKQRGAQIHSNAYSITTHHTKISKIMFYAQILERLWCNREALRFRRGESFAVYADRLMAEQGIGNFMAGQVIADLKYCAPHFDVGDWWHFALSGPGSRRGMQRLCYMSLNAKILKRCIPEAQWYRQLLALRNMVVPTLAEHGMSEMHNQDLQNCLCEWDKYERIMHPMQGKRIRVRNYNGGTQEGE